MTAIRRLGMVEGGKTTRINRASSWFGWPATGVMDHEEKPVAWGEQIGLDF